jgi:hypothetical protein
MTCCVAQYPLVDIKRGLFLLNENNFGITRKKANRLTPSEPNWAGTNLTTSEQSSEWQPIESGGHLAESFLPNCAPLWPLHCPMIHVDIGRWPLSQPSDERMEIELVDVAARLVTR